MSDVNNTPTPGQPSGESAPNEAAPSKIDLNTISGAEASALVKEAEGKGISIEELVEQKNGSSAPKSQPKQDLIKDAAAEAKRKMKIDDEEIDEDEVIKIYKARKEHQRAANKELHEGKAARKQSEDFINMMKDKGSLFEVIKKLGHDPRQLAEQYLASQLEDEMMDPRDKELRDAKRKLQGIEDMEKKQREAIEAQRNQELKDKYAKDYNDQFIDALKNSGLPQTKPMVAEMAKYIHRSAKIGFKMSASEAAQLVKEDIQTAHQNLIGSADGDMLMKLLGEDVANKIRKHDVAKIKSPEQYMRSPSREEQPDPREFEKRPNGGRMTAKEWAEHRRGKKK